MNRKLTSMARASAFSLIILAFVIIPTAPGKTSEAPPAARAMMCACCAEDGEWYQRAERITTDMRKEINRVKFTEANNGMSGMEDAPFSDGKFELTRINSRSWKVKYVAGGKSGTLSLTVPIRLMNFGVDVHDGQMGGGGGPLLYKEWRFEGSATGTGVFKGWANSKFLLVLQGRGNHCTQAEDFKHWNLMVHHGAKSLGLYGSVTN
jgi:hypothetical protein